MAQVPEIIIACPFHKFTADKMLPPSPNNCPMCWEVWFQKMYYMIEPGERKEWLEAMEWTMRHANELVEAGKFDIELFRHAKLKVTPGKEN